MNDNYNINPCLPAQRGGIGNALLLWLTSSSPSSRLGGAAGFQSPLGELRGLLGKFRGLFLLIIIVLFSSCDIDDDLQQCSYNTSVVFRYYSSAQSEEMMQNVYSHTHLLFRNDTLAGTFFINGTRQAEGLFEQALNGSTERSLRRLDMNLPAGDYNLTTWSNYRQGNSLFAPFVIGKTLRSEIVLSLINTGNTDTRSSGLLSNAEQLYYASTSFKVSSNEKITRTADLLCAHTRLNFTVRWKNRDERPDMAQPIRLRLDGVPTGYLQQESHSLNLIAAGDPLFGDKHIVKQVPLSDGTRQAMGATAAVQSLNEITATLVTYRLWDDDHPLLSIYGGADSQTPLMKTIDLHTFFTAMGWRLTNNIRQYFDILVVIDGDRVNVSENGGTAWIDGGTIGF